MCGVDASYRLSSFGLVHSFFLACFSLNDLHMLPLLIGLIIGTIHISDFEE